MDWLWIALGSGLGGIARYGCSGMVARRVGESFPWGTLVVNVVGSWVIGLFAALTAAGGPLAAEPQAGQFVVVGLCGGYTTFSSFSLQTLSLCQAGEWAHAAANAVASAALCLVAVWLGWLAGAALG